MQHECRSRVHCMDNNCRCMHGGCRLKCFTDAYFNAPDLTIVENQMLEIHPTENVGRGIRPFWLWLHMEAGYLLVASIADGNADRTARGVNGIAHYWHEYVWVFQLRCLSRFCWRAKRDVLSCYVWVCAISISRCRWMRCRCLQEWCQLHQ